MEQSKAITTVDSLVATLNERADLWVHAYYNSQILFWASVILALILFTLVIYSTICIVLWRRKYKMFKKGLLKEVVKFLQQHK